MTTNGTDMMQRMDEAEAAALDYAQNPEMDHFGGPFNGQAIRRQLFDDLVRRLSITRIVETGTNLGVTTKHMAETTGLRVLSVESDGHAHHYARLRLAGMPNVELFHGDSRAFLRDRLPSLRGQRVLCYLDAHSPTCMPLWEEIEAIFSIDRTVVAMVDDCAVPGEPQFGFRNFGPNDRLDIPTLRRNVRRRLACFFPSYRAEDETGMRRGVAVLSATARADEVARASGLLRRGEDLGRPFWSRVSWQRARTP